jgi:hypothetical protein
MPAREVAGAGITRTCRVWAGRKMDRVRIGPSRPSGSLPPPTTIVQGSLNCIEQPAGHQPHLGRPGGAAWVAGFAPVATSPARRKSGGACDHRGGVGGGHARRLRLGDTHAAGNGDRRPGAGYRAAHQRALEANLRVWQVNARGAVSRCPIRGGHQRRRLAPSVRPLLHNDLHLLRHIVVERPCDRGARRGACVCASH